VAGNGWNADTKILTVEGSGFSVAAVCQALNESGFHATVKREE
jgi:hypothetical protein